MIGLSSKAMRLDARCDAIEAVCCAVGVKTGIDQATLTQMIEDLTNTCLQKRLERVESVDPAIAAALDNRPVITDLPDLDL